MLGIPTVIGSVLGAQVAVQIDQAIFKYIVGGVMIMMLFFLFFNPNRWIEGKKSKTKDIHQTLQFVIYLAIGFYGGFIHIGVGIFLLASLVLISGYDLLKANALKVFMVLLYSPFALSVYLLNDQIHYGLALITSVGNLIGGIVASNLAINLGGKFIHNFLVVVIVLFTAKVFGVFDFLGTYF